jgi:hypothetical protein
MHYKYINDTAFYFKKCKFWRKKIKIVTWSLKLRVSFTQSNNNSKDIGTCRLYPSYEKMITFKEHS